jgi:phytoene dehydrogenase-like protein
LNDITDPERRLSMPDKSIAIVGAGIAGLSAGCYAQMNGYKSQIFEMHNIPGGLCTSWTRSRRNSSDGYTFDGCIHHLAGASPRSGLYRLWEELGAVQDRPMVYHDYLVQVEDPSGKAFTVYTDVDRLQEHLRTLAPDDGAAIDAYLSAIRRLIDLELLALPVASPGETLKLLPRLPALIKWMRINLDQYAARFNDPFLRRAFPTIQYDFGEIPMLIHLNFVAGCYNHTLGWPLGGSRPFAEAIAQRYTDLGGELHYRSRVEKILVEDDRAVGVRLADGSEHAADTVLSAADGHATIYDMLDGRYTNERLDAYYTTPPDRQDMNLHVSFGVARDMSDEPHALNLFLKEPVTLLGKERDRISVENYSFDPTMAPAGKTALKVLLDARYSYWKELRQDRERYNAAKQEVADQVLDLLEQRFPGIKGQVEVTDVATPLTIERFTGNWRGAQAWLDEQGSVLDIILGGTRTLPGLGNFYLAGQWAGGIGLSTAAIQGRKAIQTLCKRDGQRFAARVP